jgi:hypothetical protein
VSGIKARDREQIRSGWQAWRSRGDRRAARAYHGQAGRTELDGSATAKVLAGDHQMIVQAIDGDLRDNRICIGQGRDGGNQASDGCKQ